MFVQLIGQTEIDFNTLLPVTYEGTGKRVADMSDQLGYEGVRKYMSCLDSLSPSCNVDEHVHLTFLIVVDERDVDQLMGELGCPTVVCESANRTRTIIATASLSHWLASSQSSTSPLWSKLRGLLPSPLIQRRLR